MEAPRSICEALYRLHKHVRLGWVGEDRTGPEDEPNKGKFALLQLYTARDASRTFYGDPWSDRGPIYGRPFDRLQRVPIMLTLVEPQDVFSGKIVADLKRWMKPIGQRMLASAREKGAEYQSQLDDLAGEAGEHLYWSSQQTGAARPPVVAQKFLTEHDKAVLAGDTIHGVKDAFVNNIATGGEPLR